jgi:hypothetical protein
VFTSGYRSLSKAFGLIPMMAMVAIAGGCGGGSSAPASTATEKTAYPPGPTRQFIIPGGDNVVQLFGHEGTLGERAEASKIIHGWMQARAYANWAMDCAYFSRSYAKMLRDDAFRVSNGIADTCPAALNFFGKEASGSLVNTLTGPIDSLRVGAGHGYAQYHGKGGIDWIVPMDKENGHWKVANAAPINRRR